jgi:hypothetical protein
MMNRGTWRPPTEEECIANIQVILNAKREAGAAVPPASLPGSESIIPGEKSYSPSAVGDGREPGGQYERSDEDSYITFGFGGLGLEPFQEREEITGEGLERMEGALYVCAREAGLKLNAEINRMFEGFQKQIYKSDDPGFYQDFKFGAGSWILDEDPSSPSHNKYVYTAGDVQNIPHSPSAPGAPPSDSSTLEVEDREILNEAEKAPPAGGRSRLPGGSR